MHVRFSGASAPFFSQPPAGNLSTKANTPLFAGEAEDTVNLSGAINLQAMTELLNAQLGDLSDPTDQSDPEFLINPHTAELLCDLVNGGGDDKTAALPLTTLKDVVLPAFKKDAKIKTAVALSGFDVIRILREMATNSLFADDSKKAVFLERLDKKEQAYNKAFQKDVLAAVMTALAESDIPGNRQSALEALESIGLGDFPKEDTGRALWQRGYDPLTVDVQLPEAAIAVLDGLG